ncbi:32925_t:CDS:2, partial [Gigaspora margarita]
MIAYSLISSENSLIWVKREEFAEILLVVKRILAHSTDTNSQEHRIDKQLDSN